jgi:serine phosphatase RsbU (regulator of sigma subunit)
VGRHEILGGTCNWERSEEARRRRVPTWCRDGDGEERRALAGHLPILHFTRATHAVEEGYVLNFPLGFFAGHQYTTAHLTCAPGDVLLIITDGLTEVFDKKDREFGLGGAKQVLARVGDQPADRILASIVAAARHHGSQQDDQTALVVRFTG